MMEIKIAEMDFHPVVKLKVVIAVESIKIFGISVNELPLEI